MIPFHNTSSSLIEGLNRTFRRKLIDEINPNSRLVAIKGYRRVGKTTFLLSYAREKYGSSDRSCLYLNLNNFYFINHSLRGFVHKFVMEGGRVLLIDQVFKYHEWWKELLYCYDNFPELKIIFTSSSVIDFDDPLYGLKDKAEIFHLRGFSLREFIEIYSGFRYHSFSFEEILKYHMEIAADVCNKIKPLAFVDDYLTFGFYPFSLEKKNFSENLLKTANLMLEMDILSVHRMDPSYLPKVRKLLYLIALRNGKIPNITRLSEDISTSRQTVVNYINHLTVARLVNLIHKKKSNSRKNLMKLYIHNPNLLNMICPFSENRQSVYETFFYNNMSLFPFHFASPNAQFLVKEEYLFCVSDHILGRFDPNCYYATAGIERGDRKVIPLWLFGFLY